MRKLGKAELDSLLRLVARLLQEAAQDEETRVSLVGHPRARLVMLLIRAENAFALGNAAHKIVSDHLQCREFRITDTEPMRENFEENKN